MLCVLTAVRPQWSMIILCSLSRWEGSLCGAGVAWVWCVLAEVSLLLLSCRLSNDVPFQKSSNRLKFTWRLLNYMDYLYIDLFTGHFIAPNIVAVMWSTAAGPCFHVLRDCQTLVENKIYLCISVISNHLATASYFLPLNCQSCHFWVNSLCKKWHKNLSSSVFFNIGVWQPNSLFN